MIDEEEFKSLEILRDLRNRVVHEDYHPSKGQALWALELAEKMFNKASARLWKLYRPSRLSPSPARLAANREEYL